ncbi:MAG: hypothetical protein CGW95_03500 [Phenylobacterium zucineum]|nr:MAG: hypothetical protein CGW95_03500 [Phenylobacterium zucineum]
MKPDPSSLSEDAPEWSEDMNTRAIRLDQLPLALQAKLKVGRPRSPDPKRIVTLRLRTSLFEAYQAQGPDWRARMEQVLADALPSGFAEDK